MRRCFIDYNREMALVAEGKNAEGLREIFGVGRLIKLHGRPDAEFAVLVSDQFQKQGLGTEILQRLIQVARDEKVQRLVADVLRENVGMQRLCEKFGFTLKDRPADAVVRAELIL
jgi:acetyltransferase